jgi:hypothetical protein
MKRWKMALMVAGAYCSSLALFAVAQPSDWLPVGNGKISSAPKVGSVFACQTRFGMAGGAFRTGDWLRGDVWNPALKPRVSGNVAWPNHLLEIKLEGDKRVIRANNLPSTPTGIYPVQATDEAYQYDRNPNRIREQNINLELPATPAIAVTSSCLPMGLIGFTITGVAMYNALDAQGRDAPAHEILDRCNGHPERNGQYHHHDLSECLPDSSGQAGRHSDLIGYALDGFGIYGLYEGGGKAMTNADLDECHGHVGEVMWDGKLTTMYHYHLTRAYPYTLGCFKGAIKR